MARTFRATAVVRHVRARGSARLVGLALAALLALAAVSPAGARDARTEPPSATAQAGRITGHSPRVIDGDTLEVRDDDGQRIKVRVAGIDAPEREQPRGDASRLSLVALVGEGPVVLHPVKRDRYGRMVADVWRGDTNVALAQIEAGMAWHFKRYAADQPRRQRQAYASAEIEARAARRGVWSAPAPQAPWDWRRARWEANAGVETITGGRAAPR